MGNINSFELGCAPFNDFQSPNSIDDDYYDQFKIDEQFDKNINWQHFDVEDEFMKTPEYDRTGVKQYTLQEKKAAVTKAMEKRYIERKVREKYGSKNKFTVNNDYILIVRKSANKVNSFPNYLLVPHNEFNNVHSTLLNKLRNESITKVDNNLITQYLNLKYKSDPLSGMYVTNSSPTLEVFSKGVCWFMTNMYHPITDDNIADMTEKDKTWFTKSINGLGLENVNVLEKDGKIDLTQIEQRVTNAHCNLVEAFVVELEFELNNQNDPLQQFMPLGKVKFN